MKKVALSLARLSKPSKSMKARAPASIKLYTYWRSSAAYRVRIALNLKSLSFESIPVHLVRDGGEQSKQAYRNINPQGLVPALTDDDAVITQSMAICEYLDECYPGYPLLPVQALDRARVRSLALQVACDIHPLNNLRVVKYLKAHADGVDPGRWMSHWMTEGFSAIEKQLVESMDSQSGFYGVRAGLFECFLIPQVYNAERFGIEMTGFPVICNIVTQCRELNAFVDAAPENQADATQV